MTHDAGPESPKKCSGNAKAESPKKLGRRRGAGTGLMFRLRELRASACHFGPMNFLLAFSGIRSRILVRGVPLTQYFFALAPPERGKVYSSGSELSLAELTRNGKKTDRRPVRASLGQAG